MREIYTWKLSRTALTLGRRSAIMGILNVTPDSFSDGGQYFDPARAIARGVEMEQEGADIIDIGGESSRPGSEAIPEEEEIRRVVPVIEGVAENRPDSDLRRHLSLRRRLARDRGRRAGCKRHQQFPI